MKKNELRSRLMLEELKNKKSVGLHDAMELLSVSESTARRLFSRLESAGYAVRYHGGISIARDGIFDYSYDDMKTKYVSEKKRLARCAASFVKDGDAVYLDAGTTTKHLAFALAARGDRGAVSDVSFFTNSLTDFGILRERCEVSLIGGRYRKERRDFSGGMAQDILSKLHFSKCFLGADGYSAGAGFTATDFETAALCDTAIKNSDKSYILINSEKFTKTSLVTFGKGCAGLTVITDAALSPEIQKSLDAFGVKVIIAK